MIDQGQTPRLPVFKSGERTFGTGFDMIKIIENLESEAARMRAAFLGITLVPIGQSGATTAENVIRGIAAEFVSDKS